jgi:hypothetical protein
MTWSIRTDEALREWLSPETAHAHHEIDDARFYDFIACVWIDEQRIWDEGVARDNMKQIAILLHPSWPPDTIENFINDRLSEGTTILDFLLNAKKKGLLTGF